MNIILKKPIISEKSMQLAKEGLYTFLVDKEAKKQAIKKAVEEKFAVKVVAVKTANYKIEEKKQRQRRGFFTVAGYKKAMVALAKDQKIALFETEQQEEKIEEKIKEKKNLLKGTKVKIEKTNKTDKKEKK
jgi:large subunit ribosomal protein L23